MAAADALREVRHLMRGWARRTTLYRTVIGLVLAEIVRDGRSAVLNARDLPPSERGRRAFIAWCRHWLTDYDQMLTDGVDPQMAHWLAMSEVREFIWAVQSR